MFVIMIGVVRATTKFISLSGGISNTLDRTISRQTDQLVADETAIPLALMSRGNTSAETTQASGPHVTAKLAMYQ